MSSEGIRPRTGARYELTLAEPGGEGEAGDAGASILIYRGFVHMPEASIPVEVRIEGGEARASLGEGGGEDRNEVERLAAAFVRSATKGTAASGLHPPRKIVRWRG